MSDLVWNKSAVVSWKINLVNKIHLFYNTTTTYFILQCIKGKKKSLFHTETIRSIIILIIHLFISTILYSCIHAFVISKVITGKNVVSKWHFLLRILLYVDYLIFWQVKLQNIVQNIHDRRFSIQIVKHVFLSTLFSYILWTFYYQR